MAMFRLKSYAAPKNGEQPSMILSIFGNKPKHDPVAAEGRFVRPMIASDIEDVVAIIEQHDDDDAENARESFQKSLEGMFVAIDNGRIVGVTGAVQDPEAEAICWLSWTYVDENERRQGLGQHLLDGLLFQLRKAKIRKLFMATSDFTEDGEDIYAPAKALFQKIGAVLELKIDDYFGPGEARYVFGLQLAELSRQADAEQSGNLIFDELFPAAETDDGAVLTWREYQLGIDPHDAGQELDKLLDAARKDGARFVLAAIPSDLASVATEGLTQKGFQLTGTLKDYYQPGIDQLNWILRPGQS
jgi:ribosomal protein S18 acetylase RimI-like enzyme